MLKIKEVQARNLKGTGYPVVVDLRAKKDAPSSSAYISTAQIPIQKIVLRNSSGMFSQVTSVLLVGMFFFNPVLDVYADEIPLIIPGENTVSETEEEALDPIDVPDTPEVVSNETPAPETETPDAEMEDVQAETSAEDDTPASSEEDVSEIIPEKSVSPEAEPTEEKTQASSTPLGVKITPDFPLETSTTTDEIAKEKTQASSTPMIVEVAPHSFVEQATTTETTEDQRTGLSEETKSSSSTTKGLAESKSSNLQEFAEAPIPEEAPVVERVREVIVERTPPAPVINVVEEKYLFRDNECTRLDDGGFYCASPETASTTIVSGDSLPRVFVQNDGDKEIFFEDATGRKKITNNDFDDDGPSYDRESGFIVWHSLVKGRYQIMLSRVGENTIRQITDVSYNNTDPKVRGKSLVWQGWGENNWEIFYVQDVTVEPITVRRITTNNYPDMFPIISDNFITWQAFSGGSWHVFVYAIESGQISQISRPERGRYENPRFALLFENRKENGEVETVGYDVITGQEIPINSPVKSAPLPQSEKDKAVPVPSSNTSASSPTIKNPGKDDDGVEM